MKTDQKGFITKILVIIAALIALNFFFDINVFEILKTQAAQEILQPIIKVVKVIYYWLDGIVRTLVGR